MEEVNENVLALLDYSAFQRESESTGVPVQVRVEDPSGRLLHEKKDESSAGQYGFTTKAAGEYKACFSVADATTAQFTRIRIDWKVGVAATDWDALAKKENLNAMSAELRRLEETVREIHEEMIQLRRREEEMRDLNEATNTRVASFSILSLLVCVAVGAWQLFYLRSFFIRKKVL
jgi:p24 family protein delta-1